MKAKAENRFTVKKDGKIFRNDIEVVFMQEAPYTVCVVRNTGTLVTCASGTVCNPKDKWDDAEGRHVALKRLLINPKQLKAIKSAYWNHFKDAEKK